MRLRLKDSSISKCLFAITEQTHSHYATYYKHASSFSDGLALVDYFVMGEAIGIVATLFVSFYYSRKQMRKLYRYRNQDPKEYMSLHQ